MSTPDDGRFVETDPRAITITVPDNQESEPGDAVGNLHEGGPGSGPRPGEGHAEIPMHNIKVPKSGKISADQAFSAMKQMGYELDGGFAASSGVDPKTGLRTHRFKASNGQTVTLDTRQVKDAVMTGARNYNEAPANVAAAHAAKWNLISKRTGIDP